MPFESVVCPECGKADKDFVQVEPGTYYCSYHKGLFKYVASSSKSTGSDLGLCECGTIAIGRCKKCARSVCADHSGVIEQSRLCLTHYDEEYLPAFARAIDLQGAAQAESEEGRKQYERIMSTQYLAGQTTFIRMLRFLEGHRESAAALTSQDKEPSAEEQFKKVVTEIMRAAPVLANKLTAARTETSVVLNKYLGERQVPGERRGFFRERKLELSLEFIAQGWELFRQFNFDSDSRSSRHQIQGVILSRKGRVIRYSGFATPRGAGYELTGSRSYERYPCVEKFQILKIGHSQPLGQAFHSEYDRYFNEFTKLRELLMNMARLAAGNHIRSDAFKLSVARARRAGT